MNIQRDPFYNYPRRNECLDIVKLAISPDVKDIGLSLAFKNSVCSGDQLII